MGEGLASFQRRMRAIPKAAVTAVGPALIAGADRIADTMRDLAPVDEGDLRLSINVTGPGEATPAYSQPGGAVVVGPNAAAITVGNTNVRYPHLVEHGTKHAAAQPFFWPGFRLSRKAALGGIKRAIGKAIKATK
jgi:HK97 gp10 family phage protein